MSSITTNHGTFTGKTVESIVRREYGRKAIVHGGFIVKPEGEQRFTVLADLRAVEGEREAYADEIALEEWAAERGIA